MGCALRFKMDVTFFWTCNILSYFLLHLLQQKIKNIMALVSKKDFASALNVAYGTIRSKFSRKQLCCNRKGLVDTENPLNFIYLVEVNGGDQSVFDSYNISSGGKSKANVNKKIILPTKKETKVTKKVEVVSKVDTVESSATSEKPVNKEVSSVKKEPKQIVKLSLEERMILKQQQEQRESLVRYELRKKEAEVSLVERNAELKQMELEKKAGNTLPLDMVENVMTINFKAVFKSVHSQLKNIAMVMVQQLGGSKEDLNSIMIEMENILDNAVKDSKKKSAVDIEKLIEEYSEIRSRGERK
jgi:hypothetical protein